MEQTLLNYLDIQSYIERGSDHKRGKRQLQLIGFRVKAPRLAGPIAGSHRRYGLLVETLKAGVMPRIVSLQP
ncbi:hypothetical protein FHS96_002867 [Sphingomonas zeicaulis]|uniref:hypothetical protein n=1 Tax=Sphingomonas zeicaulis TaxID=1632740 RepID=UPI003D1CAB26